MFQHYLHHIKMKNSKGITLIELVVTIAITGILTVVAAGIINIGVDSYNLFSTHATMARESQNTVKILHDKISMAIPNSITSSSSSQFDFVTTSAEVIQIEYRSGDSDLRYKINSNPWKEILHNITSYSFSYAKSDNSAWIVSDPVSEINRINVSYNLILLGESENYAFNFTIRN